jgi:hypothetical protein
MAEGGWLIGRDTEGLYPPADTLGKGITEDGTVAGANIVDVGFAPVSSRRRRVLGLGRTSVEPRFLGHGRDAQRKQHHLEVCWEKGHVVLAMYRR